MIDTNTIAIELDAAIELADLAGYAVKPVGEVGWGYTPAGVRWIGRRLVGQPLVGPDVEITLAAGVDGVVTGATVRVGAWDAILIEPSIVRAILFARPARPLVSLSKA